MDKGYEVCINLMAVFNSRTNTNWTKHWKDIAASRVKTFYAVDSFGSMYVESIQHLVRKYMAALPGKEIGIHAHNKHAKCYVEYLHSCYGRLYNARSTTLMGLGRGAGNCPIEILIAFLKNPKYAYYHYYR